jgi:sigma-E factor negative regulatory protein RseC
MEGIIEHPGVVTAIADGRATVSVDTSGCSTCGHGGGCSMARLAKGDASSLMTLDAPEGLKAGDAITLQLPENRMPVVALLGYMLPTGALILGAGIGDSIGGGGGGSNIAAIIGALLGFGVAMAFSRYVIPRIPNLLPEPVIVAAGVKTQVVTLHKMGH